MTTKTKDISEQKNSKGQFVKGHGGIKGAGRPKRSARSRDMLSNALEAGADLSDLKGIALAILKDEKTNMTTTNIERILSKLMDVELELMKRADAVEANRKTRGAGKKKSTGGEEGNVVLFSSEAQG